MEQQAYEAWLTSREQHRQFLFGDAVAIAPAMGDIATAPLTTLTLNTSMRGWSAAERSAQTKIADAVYGILAHHNTMAEQENSAIFNILHTEDLTYIAGLTAGTVGRWERACLRQGRESPFADLVATDIRDTDFERRDTQLVVETAAATIELFQLGYTAARDAQSQTAQKLMRLLSLRGPNFAAAWADGQVIRHYCAENNDNAEKILAVFPRLKLTHFAIAHTLDPLHAVLRYVGQLDAELSLGNLSSELEWPPEKVAAIFTASVRALIAKRPNNPLAAARQVREHIDVTLTTENIAHVLGVTADYADGLFTPADRVLVALSSDPIARLKLTAANFEALPPARIAAQLGWTEAAVAELFTPGYRRRLAGGARNISARISAIARAFKETLATATIAKQLGWSETQTLEIFTPAVRRRIAIEHTSKAAKRVRAIQSTRTALIQKHQLPIEVINYLSSNYSRRLAHFAASKIQAELPGLPPKVGMLTWMWAIAAAPYADREIWIHQITKGTTGLRYKLSVSLDSATVENIRPADRDRTQDGDFVDDIFQRDPGDYIQELASRARVTYQEVYELMAAFSEEDDPELSAQNQAILEKIRQITDAGKAEGTTS